MKYKQIISTTLLLLLLPFGSSAQDFRWVNATGNIRWDDATKIAFTPQGDMVGLASFIGLVDFDPGPGVDTLRSINNPAMALWKADTAGNHLWVKGIGMEISAGINLGEINIDGNGNIHVLGYFSGTVDFDPGPGVQSVTSAGGSDIFVLKLDSLGNLIWVKFIQGPDQQRAYGMHVDGQGNVYYCGDFRQSADFDPGSGTQNLTSNGGYDIFVSKLDSAGQLQWVHSLGAAGFDYAWSMDGDADGNIVVGLNITGNIDYDPGPGVDTINSPYFEGSVWRLNAAGQHQWVRRIRGGGADSEIDMIAMDHLGNALVTGYFYDSLDLDPGPAAQWAYAVDDDDHFLVKLDSNGNFVWGIAPGGVGSEEPWGIGVDPMGGVYIGGYQSGTVDYDYGPGTLNLTTQGNSAGFVAKYNSLGQSEWAVLIDGASGQGFVNDIETGPGMQVYVAGYFQGIVDFDPGPGVVADTAAGYRDLFFLKLGQCVPTLATIQPAVCDSFVSPSGRYTYTSSGTYQDTLQNAAGCDSLITIQLTLTNSSTATLSPVTCGPYNSPVGNTYTTSGTYQETLTNAVGCDSLITIQLTVNAPSNGSISPVSCGPYLSPVGNLLSTSGTYIDTLTNAAGCDSLLSIQLTVVELDSSISQSGDTLAAAQDSVQYQWVYCDSGYAAVSGATQQQFVPVVSGNYAVIVTENGCSDTSACAAVTIVGLEEGLLPGDVNIYPNPAKEQLTIVIPNEANGWELDLMDAQGKSVGSRIGLNGTLSRMDISQFPTGLYFIKVTDQNRTMRTVSKLLIQR